MILRTLSVGFTSALLFGSFLSCITASSETSNDDVVDSSPVGKLSHVVARGLPPQYEAPTYRYDYPPPYQYGSPSSTTGSISSTSAESISSTAIDTSTVTTVEQSSHSSDTTISTTDDQTLTGSEASQGTDESPSTSQTTWFESSVLGITGTATWTTSEGTISTASTSLAASGSTTSTDLSSSVPTLSLNSSQLPITPSTSSRSNDSFFPTTFQKPTTTTPTVPGPEDSSSKSWSSQISLTWPPVFNGTFSASASSVVTTTDLLSGNQTSMWSGQRTAAWPTSNSQMSTRGNSSQSTSFATSLPVLSQTVTDGNPRTKTYFSSQWSNGTSATSQDGTFSNPTQMSTGHTSTFSVPTSLALTTGNAVSNTSTLTTTFQETQDVPLSTGISRSTTSQGAVSPPFPKTFNSTVSQPTSTPSSWVNSSVLGTAISPTSAQQSASVPRQSTNWTRKTAGVSLSSPPFQNSTSTIDLPSTGYSTKSSMANTTYHSPWTPSTSSVTTLTSFVPSSSQTQLSQQNSTDGSVWITSESRTSTQSTWFTYQSSSVSISTGFTSGMPTRQAASNTTYHWPTKIKSSVSSAHSSTSTDRASSSAEPGVTTTMTSTWQRWPNSTLTLQPTLSSRTLSSSSGDSSFTSLTSRIVTNTSYVPSSTPWSETDAGRTTTSPVSSRWVNTTVAGDRLSTNPGTTTAYDESSLTQVTATTWSATIGSSAPFNTSTALSRCVPKKKTHSSGLETQARTATGSNTMLTTLKTLVSTERDISKSQASDGPSSTQETKSQAPTELPKNPNFPWGGDSPIHRHQSVAALGEGIPRESLGTRWTNKVKSKMRFLWR